MIRTIQHPTYGAIVVNQNFWTGGCQITINGETLQKKSSRVYVAQSGEEVHLVGSGLSGFALNIRGELIPIEEKTKWYEYILAFFPLFFIIVWGNVPPLYTMLPVVSGAIGGAIAGLLGAVALVLMKKAHNPLVKVGIAVGIFALTVLICWMIAVAILSAVAGMA